MFNRIRLRLAILNSAVFLVVLALLSVLLYVHMSYRLYNEMDEALLQQQVRFQSVINLSEILRESHPDPQHDEKITYLIWDEHDQFMGQVPADNYPVELAPLFRDSDNSKHLKTVIIDEASYRVLQFPSISKGKNIRVTICLVRSLEDIHNTLRSLLLDIIAGAIFGAVISILAGRFLAGRALIPISKAWEKQQRFVADASHELRTPTAIVQAQTELLLRHPDNTIEQESPNIAVILKENKRMGRLLDDLLTLARSDSNQLEIQSDRIALDGLLRDISGQFSLLAETKDIEIHSEVQEGLVLWGDESRIRQLLIILLDNALKYTPSGGRIGITGQYLSQSVSIRVSDSGCGIPEEDLPRIFDRFYRGDKVRSRTEGGMGLGLSIAQWIVNAHDGNIRIQSKVNAGTQVELLFSRKKRGH